MISNDTINNLENAPTSYSGVPAVKASLDYKPTSFSATDSALSAIEDYNRVKNSSPYSYENIPGKSTTPDPYVTSNPATSTAPISKYESTNSDYNYGRISDNDDENLKDLGEGEKQQSQQREQPVTNKVNVDNGHSQDYRAIEPHTQINTNLDPSAIASDEYNTDYSGYEGYDQQQYDASAYDGAYDGNQQYDPATGQSYEANPAHDVGGYGDYSSAAENYTQPSNYAYDANPTVEPSKEPPQTTPTSAPATVAPVASGIKSPPQATSSQPGSAGIGSRAATEGRSQSRTGGSTVGSSGGTGTVSGGKSTLSQQPSASASKK